MWWYVHKINGHDGWNWLEHGIQYMHTNKLKNVNTKMKKKRERMKWNERHFLKNQFEKNSIRDQSNPIQSDER